jgi:hypothetical protein
MRSLASRTTKAIGARRHGVCLAEGGNCCDQGRKGPGGRTPYVHLYGQPQWLGKAVIGTWLIALRASMGYAQRRRMPAVKELVARRVQRRAFGGATKEAKQVAARREIRQTSGAVAARGFAWGGGRSPVSARPRRRRAWTVNVLGWRVLSCSPLPAAVRPRRPVSSSSGSSQVGMLLRSTIVRGTYYFPAPALASPPAVVKHKPRA